MTTLPVLDPNADQLDAAQQLTDDLLGIAHRRGADAARAAMDALAGRSASAFVMAVDRAVADDDPIAALAAIRDRLADENWVAPVAAELIGRQRVVVDSMGATTRRVLEAVADHDRGLPDIIVPRLAVARGLSYLPLRCIAGDVTHADAVLLPGVAARAESLWTSDRLADLALRARLRGIPCIVAVHPVARLRDGLEGQYRPPPTITRIEL